MDGIINVYKEAGFTSHDVVAKLRGICRQKKIGHTGTLDPQATGVLPVCLGSATRACEMLTDRTKEYVAELLLGQITDTQDTTGTVLEEREVAVDEVQVREVIESFVGGYDQIPPMYSARKVNGKKLYELARAGKEVERQARHVDLPAIEILEIRLPVVKFRVECSKGTYIRSLCADIGGKLGCGGTMQSLVRTRVGEFRLADALTLAQLQELRDDIGSVTKGELRLFTVLLNLFAPHICEEVWEHSKLGDGMVCQQQWPEYDESKCVEKTIEIVVQVCGKIRCRLEVAADIDAESAIAAAKADAKVAAELSGKQIVKEIYVPGKLVNIVAK